MKRAAKMAAIFAGIICVFFVAGCGLVQSVSPSLTARMFYGALASGNTKLLEETATPQTVRAVAMFGDKAKTGASSYGKIKSVSEKIDGDKAVVTVTFANGKKEDVHLVKTDGKWKVTITGK